MSYSSGLTRSDHQPSMSQLESSIQNARRDKRWVDASMDLERWLAASKAAYLAETAELPQMVSPSGGLVGKFFATKQTRQARGTSFTNDEEELRKILPKVGEARGRDVVGVGAAARAIRGLAAPGVPRFIACAPAGPAHACPCAFAGAK
eukprot:3496603-Prymnesium_polylepis.1